MRLCDLRRCRMADAVLALLRSRACSTASTATLLRSRAAVAQCVLQGCELAPQWRFEVIEALQQLPRGETIYLHECNRLQVHDCACKWPCESAQKCQKPPLIEPAVVRKSMAFLPSDVYQKGVRIGRRVFRQRG